MDKYAFVVAVSEPTLEVCAGGYTSQPAEPDAAALRAVLGEILEASEWHGRCEWTGNDACPLCSAMRDATDLMRGYEYDPADTEALIAALAARAAAGGRQWVTKS